MNRKLLIFCWSRWVVAGGVIWWVMQREEAARQLVLYGNIDLRQIQLAFNNSERIAVVLVQEGDHVQQGQMLARLDTSRLEPLVAQAVAQAAAQRQVVTRLRNGSRPEEIAQARAMSQRPKPISPTRKGNMSGLKAPRNCAVGRGRPNPKTSGSPPVLLQPFLKVALAASTSCWRTARARGQFRGAFKPLNCLCALVRSALPLRHWRVLGNSSGRLPFLAG